MAINWNARGTELYLQNAQNLCGLRAYDVPYIRLLGLPADIIGGNAATSVSMTITKAREMIAGNEPRISVDKINIKAVDDGGDIVLEVTTSGT